MNKYGTCRNVNIVLTCITVFYVAAKKHFSSSSSLFNHLNPRSFPNFAAFSNCSLANWIGFGVGSLVFFLGFLLVGPFFKLNFVTDVGSS